MRKSRLAVLQRRNDYVDRQRRTQNQIGKLAARSVQWRNETQNDRPISRLGLERKSFHGLHQKSQADDRELTSCKSHLPNAPKSAAPMRASRGATSARAGGTS